MPLIILRRSAGKGIARDAVLHLDDARDALCGWLGIHLGKIKPLVSNCDLPVMY
jgi:hypothetical protein